MATEQTAKKDAAAKSATGAVPKVGDMVLYVLPDGSYPGEIRPAVIVKVWGDQPDSYVNLQVFTDSMNDYITAHPGGSGIMWRTSVEHDEHEKSPGSYHRIA
ncbi:MAG TPA: hypothetical protein VHV10_02775 [Ktedonobacteraceae bacterium]|jgi:hypothetical protein|nr:hypothetical protein [Ktedonobacteraceae bacterium]